MARASYPTTNDTPPQGSFVSRHATGLTIVAFFLLVLLLSVAPLPDWLRPIDGLSAPEGWSDLAATLARRGAALPKKGDTAAHDWAIAEEEETLPVDDDGPKPELSIAHTDPAAKDEPAPPAPWQKPARPKLEQYRARLGLVVSPLETPCVPTSSLATACPRHAMDRFFAALRAAGEHQPGAVARVVHYGDSIIASDHITDVVRIRLQERFGSAGKGFLLPTRYNERQRRLRTGDGTKGWVAEHIAQGDLKDRYFGYAGAAFTAGKDGEETVFTDLGENRKVDVYYLAQPQGGVFELYADAQQVAAVDTLAAAAPDSRFYAAVLPAGTKSLKLRAKNKGVRVFGVALEAEVPGVIYESIGVPGSTAEVWLYPDADGFRKQLAHRKPALVVTMLGGNDARTLHQKRTTLADIEQHTRAMLRRLKESAPEADCLIVSPLDAVVAKASGEMKSKPEVPMVIEVQRKVAEQEGCGFWSMYASMGGQGSLERWFKASLINPDLIHPKSTGGDLLGELMAEALMNAYDARMVEPVTASRGQPN